MMRRFHKAKLAASKKGVVWGKGKPMRDFLHVDDMAAACVHVMNLSHDKFVAPHPTLCVRILTWPQGVM